MKSKLLVLVLLTTISYSQTYSFSKLLVKANIETVNGNEQRIIETKQGPFKFVFETPSDPSIKKLFTILNPGMTNRAGLPWFGLIEDTGYLEKNNILFKKSIYYDTKNDEKLLVLIANDKSIIVIFNSDNTIYEYIR
jgi:hypothetical protein